MPGAQAAMPVETIAPHASSAQNGEAEPLLGHGSRQASNDTDENLKSSNSATSLSSRGTALVNLLSVIMFFVACSAGFLILPHMRILEDILCRDYYSSSPAGLLALAGLGGHEPIDELRCKIEPVQSRLTGITGFKAGLEALASFVAAFPWGLAADRIGRKPVFALALAGAILNVIWVSAVMWFHDVLPIDLIIVGSAGPFLGGGDAVMFGVLLSMITDATTDAERSLCFLRIHVATMCGFLLSPTLSSFMMERTGTPWYNIIIGCGLLCFGAAAISFVPETLKNKATTADEEQEDGRSSGQAPRTLWEHTLHVYAQFLESLSILKSRSLIILLCICLAYMPVLNGTIQFMTQFISKRYSITLARTGYIQTAYGVMQIIQSLIILPWIMKRTIASPEGEQPKHRFINFPSRLLARDEQHRDFNLAVISFALLLLGGLILAIAPTLPVFITGLGVLALGTGYNSLTRALMSLYVDSRHTSRLFSLTGMAETLGGVYSSPMLAALFSLGMKLGGGWIGLPYYGLSVFMGVCIVLLMLIRLPGVERVERNGRADL